MRSPYRPVQTECNETRDCSVIYFCTRDTFYERSIEIDVAYYFIKKKIKSINTFCKISFCSIDFKLHLLDSKIKHRYRR